MRRKLTSLLFAAVAIAAFTSSSANAGSVYVPIEPMAVGDQVFVSVSNPTGEQKAFDTYLISHHNDGTVRDEDPVTRLIGAGDTIVLRNQLPLGQRGLLEITSFDNLAVSARLGNTQDTAASVMGPSVPVITSDNLGPAAGNLYLQGLQREVDGTIVSNVRLVNLGHEAANCNATITNTTGGVQGGFLSFPNRLPLSVTAFDDGLQAVLGNEEFGDLRVRFSCDQQFYIYSVTHQPATGASVFIGAAYDPANSTLRRPGDEQECPQDTFCFEEFGIFHVPTSGNKVRRIDFPTPPGDYTQVHVTMDVKLGNWMTPSSGLHNIFWLALERNRNLIGYMNLKGPNSNTVLFRHGIGQAQEDKAKVTVPATFVPGQTYHFDYLYDTSTQLIDFVATDSSGQEVARIIHSPDVNKLSVTNTKFVRMDFGFTGVNPNEPATIGWEYRDLVMKIRK